MKLLKGLFTTLLIFTLLVGSIGLFQSNHKGDEENTIIVGEFTIQQEPNPMGD